MARRRRRNKDTGRGGPGRRAKRPDNSSKELEVALQMQRAGLLDQAKSVYEEVLAKSPRNPKALYLLGTILFHKNDPRGAEPCFRKVVRLQPDSASAHNNLGQVLEKLGRLDDAVECYRRADKIEPESAKTINNLGHVWQAMGRIDEAAGCFTKVLKIEPGNARALLDLGSVHQRLDRLEEARDCFQQALDLEPENAAPLYAMAILYEEQSLSDKAMEYYRRALELSPGSDKIRNNLGILRRYLPVGADELASRGSDAEAKPDDAGVLLRYGTLLLRSGDVDGAASVFEKAAKKDAGNAEARYYIGAALARLGRRRQAAREYKAALEINSGEVFAAAALASMEAAATDEDRAKSGKRVALHLGQKFHYNILRPVFDALRELGHTVIITPHVSAVVDFRPDVVVVAESQSALLRGRLPDALFVWVRHGLISKNTTTYAARICDFACLTSDESKAWYISRGGRPRKDFWITGYPQMDPLFSAAELPLDLDLGAGRKTVLYAPTWTGGLSSAPMLGERVGELIRGERDDLTIIIKPHPATAVHNPGWLKAWRQLAGDDPNMFLIEDTAADIMPYLKAADVLVSDASSVIFQYLATDRPIVLISNPDRFGVSHFDPGGIEWQRREVGIEVEDVAHLAAAVNDALERPGARSRQRARCREDLFGECTDGRAAKRIAHKITEL